MITCDKCGPAVAASYIVKLISGELAFCGHHYRKMQDGLDKAAYEVVDLSIQEEQLVKAE